MGEPLSKLGRALRFQIQYRGLELPALSEELGFSGEYLGRTLVRQRRLRLDLVFRLLERLDLSPMVFFSDVFTFGGSAAAEVLRRAAELKEQKQQAGLLDPDEPDLRETAKAMELARGRLRPEEYERRAAELLHFLLRRAGIPQARASVALALGPHALNQVLGGRTRLHCVHVFGILALLQMSPGRFFLELLLPRPPTPEERREQTELMDWLSMLLEDASQALLNQLDGKAEPEPDYDGRALGVLEETEGD